MILRERLSAKAIAYLRTSPFVIGAVEHKENESASRYILCRAPQEAQGSQAKKDAAAEMAFKSSNGGGPWTKNLASCHKIEPQAVLRMPGVRGSLLQLGF